jgi:hypothetical protein
MGGPEVRDGVLKECFLLSDPLYSLVRIGEQNRI